MKAVRIICAAMVLAVFATVVWLFLEDIPNLTAGVVVDKTAVAARTELFTYSVGSGENRRTRLDSHYSPASWRIRVEGIGDDGIPSAEWWDVGEGLYELIQIGDCVNRDAQTGAITYQSSKERGN